MGCLYIDQQSAIESAIYIGYRHFDTASFYKNEYWIGKEVFDHIFMKGYSRLDFFITSKIQPGFQEYSKAKKIIE